MPDNNEVEAESSKNKRYAEISIQSSFMIHISNHKSIRNIHEYDHSGWIDQRGRITDEDKTSSVMLASNSG